MHSASPFILPLASPTLIFAVVLLVILFSPLLLNRLRVPPLVGLVLAGIALGPFGFNVLSNDDSFHLFGNVGLLYVVFMSGVSIEINDLRKNRIKGGVFGFYSFVVAITLGLLSGMYLLHFSFATSVLLASMYATHTLVAYPVVSRFCLGARRPVKIATVSSIITVTASLVILTLVSDQFSLLRSNTPWLLESAKMILFAFIVLWLYPKIAHSFFKRFEDSVLQYIFVLALVFFGAFFAQVAGLEGVLGAFMVGISLNRLIPKISPLMNRLEFVGSALFVPFFLISLGMIINFRVLGSGFSSILVALVMVLVPVCSKWIVALLTQKTFSMNSYERQMIFGLSNGQAGITLVTVMIGYAIILPDGSHLLPDSVMAGAVIMILVSGTISMLVTENAARKMLSAGRVADDSVPEEKRRERIMFTVANPHTLDHLVELSVAIKSPRSKEDLYALRVVNDNDEVHKEQGDRLLLQAAKVASVADQWVERISRYDVNVASGILYSAKEYAITDVVIGLHQKLKSRDTLFGLMTEMLLKGVSCSLFIYKPVFHLKQTSRLIVILPGKAELEVGFGRCFAHVSNIARKLHVEIMVYSTPETRAIVMHHKQMHHGVSLEFFLYHSVEELHPLSGNITDADMCVFFAARPNAISYDETFDKLVENSVLSDTAHNVLVVYPEQYEKPDNTDERFSTLHQPHYKFERLHRSERWIFVQLQREWNRLIKMISRR
jgi:Kef-type K+ transport system membrane component KefB